MMFDILSVPILMVAGVISQFAVAAAGAPSLAIYKII
jgi:hypothetical protein